MKQLKIAFVLLEALCIFTLSGCLEGGSVASAPVAGETIAKPIEPAPDKKDETIKDVGLSPEDGIRLKPRDKPPTDLEKITLNNGLVINVPKSEVSGINVKAMKSQVDKPEVIVSGNRSFTVLRKSKSEDKPKLEEKPKSKGGKIKSMNTNPMSEDVSAINDIGIMGRPYDSFRKAIVSGQVSCLRDKLSTFIWSPDSNVKFEEFNDQDSLYNSVNASLGVEVGVGPVASVSVVGSFLSSGQADSRSTNIYYIFRSNNRADLMGVKEWSNPLDSLTVDYVGSPKAFRTKCGDSYVYSANAGILMIVRLRLGFNSGIDKTEFALALNASVGSGLADVSAKITSAMVQTNVKVSLTIDAMQLGGDWLELPKVMGVETDNIPVNATSGISSVNCVIGVNVDHECQKTITDIYNYALTLKSQLNGTGNYYYDRLDPILYSEDLDLGPGFVDTSGLEGKIKEFSLKYDLANKYLKLISDFNLRYTSDTRSELAAQLNKITKKLVDQIDDVFYVPELQAACYNEAYPTDSCDRDLDAANRALMLDKYKLQPNQMKLLEDYLPKQQFRVGGLGLPRGDRGIGVCYLVPITLASDKDVYFKLDCGLGDANPEEDILFKSVNDKQIVTDDFSYSVGNPSVKVTCSASGGGSELVFNVDEVGDTYTAKGAVCKKDGVQYSAKDEKDLVLQRIKD